MPERIKNPAERDRNGRNKEFYIPYGNLKTVLEYAARKRLQTVNLEFQDVADLIYPGDPRRTNLLSGRLKNGQTKDTLELVAQALGFPVSLLTDFETVEKFKMKFDKLPKPAEARRPDHLLLNAGIVETGFCVIICTTGNRGFLSSPELEVEKICVGQECWIEIRSVPPKHQIVLVETKFDLYANSNWKVVSVQGTLINNRAENLILDSIKMKGPAGLYKLVAIAIPQAIALDWTSLPTAGEDFGGKNLDRLNREVSESNSQILIAAANYEVILT